MKIKTIVFILIILSEINSLAVEQKNSCHSLFVSRSDNKFEIDYLVEVYANLSNEKPGIRRDMLLNVLLKRLGELKLKEEVSLIQEFYEKTKINNNRLKALSTKSRHQYVQNLLKIDPMSEVYFNDTNLILKPRDQKTFFELNLKLNKLTEIQSLTHIFKSRNRENKLLAKLSSTDSNNQLNDQFIELMHEINGTSDLQNYIFLNQNLFLKINSQQELQLFKKSPQSKNKYEQTQFLIEKPVFIGNMSNDLHLFTSKRNLLIYNSKHNQSQIYGLPEEYALPNHWNKILFTANEIYIPSFENDRYYFERLTYSSDGSILKSTVSVDAHGKDEIFQFLKNHQVIDYKIVLLPANKGKYVLFEITGNNLNQSGKIEKIGLFIDYTKSDQFNNPYYITEYTNDSDFYIYENHFFFKKDQLSAFEISKINKFNHLNLLVLPQKEQLMNASIGSYLSVRSFKNNLEVHINSMNEIDIYELSTRTHKLLNPGLPKKAIIKEIQFVSGDDYLMITYFLKNEKYLIFISADDLRQ